MLKAAKKLGEGGRRVLPCRHADDPRRPKEPYWVEGMLERGHLDATSDRSRIHALWTRFPGASIGAVLEREAVVDIESLEGHGVDGFASLKTLETELGELPKTRTHGTANGGEHRVCTIPEGVRLENTELAPGVELKVNGYVLVPPSPGYSILDASPKAELPTAWAELALSKRGKERATGARDRSSQATDGERITEGRRYHFLKPECGRLHDGTRDLPQLTEDLDAINLERCDPPWERWEVEKLARSIFQLPSCKPPRDPRVDEALRRASVHWYEELLRGGGRSKMRDVFRAALMSAAKRGELRTVVLEDDEMVEGLAFSDSCRQLAETANTSAMSAWRHLRALEDIGVMAEVEKRDGLASTWLIVVPAQHCYTPNNAHSLREERDIGGGVTLTRADELETPMYGWRSPVGNAGGGVLAALEAFGPQTPEELAERLGTSRPRDLERRHLERLTVLHQVEDRGGVYALPEDYRERSEALQRERYTTVSRRRVRTRTNEGRTVTSVEETVTEASEEERREERCKRHAKDREKFRRRRLLAGTEGDRQCRELLNDVDRGREADGLVSELERVEPPDPEDRIRSGAEVFGIYRRWREREVA